MSSKEILTAAEEKMTKTLEALTEELKTFRTGRPNPEIFKKVKVDCYGSPMNLSDIAGITVPDGRTLQIQPFDKTNLKAIEQAISNSDLGLNPTNDGNLIRINVPALTEDRRKELSKQVGKAGEERGKIPVRNIRRDGNDAIKKLKGSGISEDEVTKALETLEKSTNKFIEKIDELVEKKEKELKTV